MNLVLLIYFTVSAILTDPATAPVAPVQTVAADGSAQFTTIQAAIDAAPENAPVPYTIRIKPGRYKEHVTVPPSKPFIYLLADNPETAIITDDKNIFAKDNSGKQLGTPQSSTVFINAPDFSAENVTFENTAGNHGQALAAYVTSDRATFRNCRFIGWQDTLRPNKGRQYYVNCYIEGHVDFIYAAATAYFDRCHIHCVADGYISAASTDEKSPFGFVFDHCKITAADTVKRTYLGRPWRPFANVIFINCDLPAQIDPSGWNNWAKAENEKTARFAEYKNTGPGADRNARATWARELTDDEAKAVTVETVLGGSDHWNPKSD